MKAIKEAVQKLKIMGGLPTSLLSVLEAALREDAARKFCDCNQGRLPCTCKPTEQHQGEPVACAHEWTDDGEFMLVCTVCGAQENHDPKWRDMATAPRDGTLVRLLVEFIEHATEDSEAMPSPTIGANSFDHTGEDLWQFAGWSWEQDCFTQGVGEPVGWLPLLDTPHVDPAEVERLKLEIEQLRLSLTLNDAASIQDDCVRTENRTLAAEVERLRDQLTAWQALAAERLEVATGLRAQASQHKLAMDAACAEIAERDALLARVVNSGALSSEQYESLEAECCALSVSAEPEVKP